MGNLRLNLQALVRFGFQAEKLLVDMKPDANLNLSSREGL